MDTKNLLDTAQAAEVLSLSRRHVRWLIRKGYLPHIKLGRDYFIHRHHLRADHPWPRPGRPKKIQKSA